MEADRRRAGLLGQQAALHRAQAEVALAHGLVVGARHRGVELDQGLALLDQITLPDQHLLDDAAAQVLDCLALGVDGDHAMGRHALVERSQSGPEQEAAETQAQHPQADAGRATGIGGRLAGWGRPGRGGDRGRGLLRMGHDGSLDRNRFGAGRGWTAVAGGRLRPRQARHPPPAGMPGPAPGPAAAPARRHAAPAWRSALPAAPAAGRPAARHRGGG